jgi:hypothetical protein
LGLGPLTGTVRTAAHDPADYTKEEAYSIRPKKGWGTDGAEFQVTEEKIVVLTPSRVIPYDLTLVNGPREERIRDVGFQEIDLETGELLFEWSWLDHFDITDVIQYPRGTDGNPDTLWDLFYINSVHKDSTGNYYVSSRYTNKVCYINGRRGDFIWKLGGKGNMFEDLSEGATRRISMQHYARFLKENATLTLFNNGVSRISN